MYFNPLFKNQKSYPKRFLILPERLANAEIRSTHNARAANRIKAIMELPHAHGEKSKNPGFSQFLGPSVNHNKTVLRNPITSNPNPMRIVSLEKYSIVHFVCTDQSKSF